MLEHIVMFRFLETAGGNTKAQNLLEAKRRMLALTDEIPEIVDMNVYLAAENSAPGNYDFILISHFEDAQALDTYQKHPAHVAFGQFVKGLRHEDGRACIDCVVPHDLS